MTTPAPAVIPLRPEEVPKDMVCAICLSIPLEPFLLRQCSHVFCNGCITEYLSRNTYGYGIRDYCPVCREDCTRDDICRLSEANPLAHRIWSNIAVKCDHHETSGCSWTGSLSDYQNHKSNQCVARSSRGQQRRRRSDSDQEIFDDLKEQVEQLSKAKETLQRELGTVRVSNIELTEKERALRQEYVRMRNNWATMEAEFNQLKNMVQRMGSLGIEQLRYNGRGGYAYDRDSVVSLSKFICQNLECKPAGVNSNKSFECIRNIYSELCKNYDDNPPNLSSDVQMLLGICSATYGWFSMNQMHRIDEMSRERYY